MHGPRQWKACAVFQKEYFRSESTGVRLAVYAVWEGGESIDRYRRYVTHPVRFFIKKFVLINETSRFSYDPTRRLRLLELDANEPRLVDSTVRNEHRLGVSKINRGAAGRVARFRKTRTFYRHFSQSMENTGLN